ncbi:MAG TPA: serine protease [Elusimicrobiota bacterium]|nr:serine protease [Elusimicrobiota bacterium]
MTRSLLHGPKSLFHLILVSLLAAAETLGSPRPAFAADAQDALKKSVVKIYTVSKEPDYTEPWRTKEQEQGSGSGCILPGNRILTNAHVVGNQVFLQVSKPGDPERYEAKVEFVAHDGELALLSVDDPVFFKNTRPVSFGDLPRQRDKLAAYGFPVGGEELSITEGIVSRIEVQRYQHSRRELLAIQTDAAINPGNSGGPVFKEGKLAGISFQSLKGGRTENIGYAIPTPIIQRFLKDVDDGDYDGVPSLGIFWQKLENATFRKYCGLAAKESGILVTKIPYGAAAVNAFQVGDVLLSIDGQPVANDGTVSLRGDERVEFSHLISTRQIGEPVQLKILRDGRRLDATLALGKHVTLVSGPQYDTVPTYFIFGGLVFMPLSHNYIEERGMRSVLPAVLDYLFTDLPTKERRQVVLISKTLPHNINVGYHYWLRDAIVKSVNNVPVAEMRDVLQGLQKPEGPYHVIELESPPYASRIILDAAQAEKATREILERFQIPADRSEDLK